MVKRLAHRDTYPRRIDPDQPDGPLTVITCGQCHAWRVGPVTQTEADQVIREHNLVQHRRAPGPSLRART